MKVTGLFRGAQETRTYAAGDVVFREGDDGHHMYGVIAGRIEVRKGDRVLDTCGPDDVFGELALVDHVPRTATAVAVEDSELALIDEHRFLFLVHETPMFALQVMSSLGERIRAHDQDA
jgi:CRP-like cAMP-binding protein